MPSTVRSLFAAAEAQRTGVVSWGARIPPPAKVGIGTGVYVAALTEEFDSTERVARGCPLSRAALQELLAARPELTLDGERPDAEALGDRLAAFWCPDEVIVYIGSAGPRKRVAVSELSDRVEEYYGTPLGARSPHAGGWPLKTLGTLSDVYVHYAYCDDVLRREKLMLDAFAGRLSDETRAALHDPALVMPFANLEDARKRRKAHGIKGARAPRVRSRQAQPSPAMEDIDASARATPAAIRSTMPTQYQTQRITAADIRRGVIRIPSPAKVLFPGKRAYIEIDLRGERTTCRWDPRYGPDQERSGVLGIGTALTRRLVHEGERLRVTVDAQVVSLADSPPP